MTATYSPSIFLTLLILGLFSSSELCAQITPIPGALSSTAGSTFTQAPMQPHQQVMQNYPPPRVGMNRQPLVRIKDITTVEGHRTNRLTGTGLVIGLKGTGGKSDSTQQALQNALQKYGLNTDQVATGAAAIVMVSAEVPAFSWGGEKVTANVGIIDDTTSLVGGLLMDTPLDGYDGQTYAVAAGPINLSGFSADGAAGSVAKNHDTSGKVEAQIEVAINNEPAFPKNSFRLILKNKDYATAHRIATRINQSFPGTARASDPSRVEVYFPRKAMNDKLGFVTKIGSLTVTPDVTARVVINQRTGTIVVGQHVKLLRVMFANENLVITTNETPIASQPAPFSEGQTAILPRTQLSATETGGTYNQFSHETTVGDLANMLNTLGVRPRDLINIFQNIKATGALQADLIVE